MKGEIAEFKLTELFPSQPKNLPTAAPLLFPNLVTGFLCIIFTNAASLDTRKKPGTRLADTKPKYPNALQGVTPKTKTQIKTKHKTNNPVNIEQKKIVVV